MSVGVSKDANVTRKLCEADAGERHAVIMGDTTSSSCIWL
jgi:hypothetical protein